MLHLHVITRREELDPKKLADKAVVVLDVLFATSTIIAALAHGAREVMVATAESEARAQAARLPAGSYLLAGEYHLQLLPGFASFAPLALLKEDLAGKCLIYSTTNGTVALRQAEGAPHVYVAALLNAEPVAAHLCAHHAEDNVLLLCAGSIGRLNLEDFYAAGLFVDRLMSEKPQRWAPTDSALAALAAYRHYGVGGAEACLMRSRVGRLMQERGGAEEVRFAAQLNVYPIVPRLQDGRIR